MRNKSGIADGEFRALAELRYQIRSFVQQGDMAAREAGLEPQQYLLLLAIRGLPLGKESTIRVLAERLSLQHHSAVELVNRMELHGYVRRLRSKRDRRNVMVYLQPRGEKLLEQVARKRLVELRANGRALVEVIIRLVNAENKLKKRTSNS
jgi:DNA-binding MarR family transcriptional regulator